MAGPGGAAQRTAAGGKGRGALGWLLVGIVIGVLGTVFLPDLASPYLPGALRGERVEVAGVVEAKSSEAERLLLTVGSEAGAMLATFHDGIAEIDLLVSVGDSVLLMVDEYAPFVDDARISRVMKQRDWRAAASDTAEVSWDTAGTPEDAVDTNGMMDTSETVLPEATDVDTTPAEAAEETPPAPTS